MRARVYGLGFLNCINLYRPHQVRVVHVHEVGLGEGDVAAVHAVAHEVVPEAVTGCSAAGCI
jgi:hypothetical protein